MSPNGASSSRNGNTTAVAKSLNDASRRSVNGVASRCAQTRPAATAMWKELDPRLRRLWVAIRLGRGLKLAVHIDTNHERTWRCESAARQTVSCSPHLSDVEFRPEVSAGNYPEFPGSSARGGRPASQLPHEAQKPRHRSGRLALHSSPSHPGRTCVTSGPDEEGALPDLKCRSGACGT